MLSILLSGTVSKPPETRQTSKGGTFAFTTVRVQHPDGDLYASVTVFDPSLVAVLTGLGKGDAVTVAGTGKLSIYTGRDNEPRPSLSVTASRIISIADKAAPPRARPARQYAPAPAPAPAAPMQTDAFAPVPAGDFEDSDIPF